MTKEEIGLKLKAARLSAGLTQAGVAEQLGKRQQVVGHWETGYSQPDANTLITLCDLYGKTIDEVLGRDTISLTKNDISAYLVYERKRTGMSLEEVCAELKAHGHDVTSDALDKYERNGNISSSIYRTLGEIYGSGRYMDAFGLVHNDDVTPSPPVLLTPAAQRVGLLYDKASEDDRLVVEAALRKYDAVKVFTRVANKNDGDAAAEETAADLAPVLTVEQEADEFAAMAKEQYLLQKKQESEASSAKKSG